MKPALPKTAWHYYIDISDLCWYLKSDHFSGMLLPEKRSDARRARRALVPGCWGAAPGFEKGGCGARSAGSPAAWSQPVPFLQLQPLLHTVWPAQCHFPSAQRLGWCQDALSQRRPSMLCKADATEARQRVCKAVHFWGLLGLVGTWGLEGLSFCWDSSSSSRTWRQGRHAPLSTSG